MAISLDVNLNLPETPKGVPDELFSEFRRIYNAIRLLSSYANTLAGLIAAGGGGTATNISQFVFGQEGEQGEQGSPIPGPRGEPGIQGIQGLLGSPGLQGEDGEEGLTIVGPQGIQGAAGIAGADGLNGITAFIVSEGADGEDAQVIPGPKGLSIGLSYTSVTKNLGVSGRSGTFDITGLSGLTTGKMVNIIQTAEAVASKGNAIDEVEMDLISLTGYVLNSTTIRVYWSCAGGNNVAVGEYTFAYCVSA